MLQPPRLRGCCPPFSASGVLRFGSYVEVEREELCEQVVVWGEAVGA
jgi:hypothetical protein